MSGAQPSRNRSPTRQRGSFVGDPSLARRAPMTGRYAGPCTTLAKTALTLEARPRLLALGQLVRLGVLGEGVARQVHAEERRKPLRARGISLHHADKRG